MRLRNERSMKNMTRIERINELLRSYDCYITIRRVYEQYVDYSLVEVRVATEKVHSSEFKMEITFMGKNDDYIYITFFQKGTENMMTHIYDPEKKIDIKDIDETFKNKMKELVRLTNKRIYA
jgi:hypothetical protein